jgi:trans-aconitate methyltransferase
VLDLACGTGVDTVEMSRRVKPGEVVGVDCSEGMLVAAVDRARRDQLALTPVCGPVEPVVASLSPCSFDVVSLRFALAYLDWRTLLPRLGPLLRRGGRVGVLTSLASSAPQAYSVYRAMVDSVGAPDVELNVPCTASEVAEALAQGGLRAQDTWEETTQLAFASGSDAMAWLRESGYAVHPVLDGLDPQVLAWLMGEFARRLEAEAGGSAVVLDLHFAGVVVVA